MNRSICWVMTVACLGLAKVADAAAIVDWGGSYVSASAELSGRAGDYTVAGTGLWIYNETTRSSPTAGYVAPEGKSGTFYWGGYLVRSDGAGNASARNWSLAQVTDAVGGDYIEFYRGNNTVGLSFTGAAFVAFLKDGFLNGYDDTPVSFTADSTLSVTTSSSVSGEYRFAVQVGDQWYLSQASRAAVGTLSLSGQVLLDSMWAAWSPNGGANSRLGNVPTEFSVLGSTFGDIQGFGIYAGFEAPSSSSSRIQITDFSMVTVPEPSVCALFGVAGVWGMIAWRRRLKK